MKDHKVDAVAAGASLAEIDVSGWNGRLEALFGRVAACFSDGRAWRQAQLYVVGLLSGAARKNGWTLAELAGDRGPQKMQRLLSSYEWDADEVRDVTRSYALEQLGEPDGVLVLDETGFLKKGTESVGVQRQYSGTAGRTENCQIGVFAAYVSAKGRCLVDRRIYLPKSWTDDPARCQGARVPDTVAFATKPALARDMVEDFLRVEPRLRWVAGDEVYGADPGLRDCLEAHNIGYVLGVACDRRVSTAAGAFTVSTLAAMVPDHGWETYSAADGSKGPRLYDWALVDTTETVEKTGRPRQVLIRRPYFGDGDPAFFMTYSPRPVPMAKLVTVAGRRWGVEECFQSGKNEVGLDHYQVRLYHAWYRHITLAMLAQAWLASIAAGSTDKPNDTPDRPAKTATGYARTPDGLTIDEPPKPDENARIPLTLNEIRHIISLIHPAVVLPKLIRWWSNWRRRHQKWARYYHYRRRIRKAQAESTSHQTRT